MLDALVRGIGVVTDRGTDPADLVGGHGRADAGPADEDPAIRPARRDGLAEPPREVRVVVGRVGTVAAEVDQVVPGVRRAEAPEQFVLEGGPGMVGREGDAHLRRP